MTGNPWTGVNAWREFVYDVRHPVLFWRRARAGLKDAIRFIQNGFQD